MMLFLVAAFVEQLMEGVRIAAEAYSGRQLADIMEVCNETLTTMEEEWVSGADADGIPKGCKVIKQKFDTREIERGLQCETFMKKCKWEYDILCAFIGEGDHPDCFSCGCTWGTAALGVAAAVGALVLVTIVVCMICRGRKRRHR